MQPDSPQSSKKPNSNNNGHPGPAPPAAKPKLYTRTFEQLFNDDIRHVAESSPIADATPLSAEAAKFMEIVLERLDTIKTPAISNDEVKNTPLPKDETPVEPSAEAAPSGAGLFAAALAKV